uniref:NADP-dependent oxidoreductase domain-containing protein n=1 Tax=Globisporangium ultimum (strain ATCC 200006 / CBS 805.95 / DAOM BR144) TaxID=431595 RepID=K3WXI9_GLOUD
MDIVYRIFERSCVDYDYVNLYKKYKYGLTTWCLLASGVLTGKYSSGVPEGTRLSIDRADLTEDHCQRAAKLIGTAFNRWCASNPNVWTVILGAPSISQLEENLKANAAIDKVMPEIKAHVDETVQFVPKVVENDAFSKVRTKWLQKTKGDQLLLMAC